jgi:TolB-like protein/tetratricopeptide (TPR) repeat protein
MTTMSGEERHHHYRFGRFEVDVRAAELRKDGVRLRLQGQPFDVLVMLLRRPGDIVTREQLRQQLWPDGTFVDFEHGLNAAVKRLRAALGDSAENPRYVETLHRRGYRFIGTLEHVDRAAAAPGGAPRQRQRLAVLPFLSLAGPEYFAEGLREEMITQLGRLCAGRLGVIARTSSTLIQRTASRVRDIGEALGVDFVVEGNVRGEGDRARITVQLVETRGETQLWAESYERHLSDCFRVQSEVATEIVHSLAVELLSPTSAALSRGTRDLGAHQAYLKGRYHWNRPADEGITQAIVFFEQAVELDRRFACAHAALGRVHVSAVNYQVLEPRPALERARQAARRALELDPADSEAHLTLAEVGRILEWDWSGAEKCYRTALAFNPSSVAAHRHYGLFLAARGRLGEASSATEQAYELDPLCLEVNTNAAWVRFLARDYESAAERCRHTLDMDGRFAPARCLLAVALVQAGRVDEATGELEALAADGADPVTLSWLTHGFAAAGRMDRARELLAELDQLSRDRYVSAYHRAIACAATGDRSRALGFLEEATEQRDPAITNLGMDPKLDALRSDRRYAALVARLALTT